MTKNRTIQLYRGTTAQNNAYTGVIGELTMDTTTNELRLHDGSTAGGHVIGSINGADYVVESQFPTAENNYMWYRKYKSGWVEQGSSNPQNLKTIVFPIEMADTNYTATCMGGGHYGTGADVGIYIETKRTTGFTFQSDRTTYVNWEVKGMAAN